MGQSASVPAMLSDVGPLAWETAAPCSRSRPRRPVEGVVGSAGRQQSNGEVHSEHPARRATVPTPQRETQAPLRRLGALSDQEGKILPLIADGKTNREIAEALYLSEHTVKAYVSDLLSKLALRRRSEAAAFVRPDPAPVGISQPAGPDHTESILHEPTGRHGNGT